MRPELALSYAAAATARRTPCWHISVCFVPSHGAIERRADRAGRETQFASGFRAFDEHFMPGDFHAFDGNLRSRGRRIREISIFSVGEAESDRVRNLQPRRGFASDGSEAVEELFECEIFRAEQVAFADAALFGDEQMALRRRLPQRQNLGPYQRSQAFGP